jgi:hypothetical protein
MKIVSPHSFFGDVRNGNYAEIDPLTGLIKLRGLARPYLGAFVPLTAMEQTAAPDYDGTNLGYLFPNNDATEFLTANFCLNNDYAAGTSLYPRLVWHQASADVPTWKIAYRWINPGAQVSAVFTTVASTSEEFTYIQGTIQQISHFAAIVGTGRTMGSILQVKLYREDADLAGDALAVAFGFFKQVDGLGSQTIVRKVATDVLASASPSSSVSSSPSTSISSSPSSSPSTSISGSPSSSASISVSSSPSSSVSSSPSSSASSSPSSSPSTSSSISSSPSASTSSSISSSPSSSPSPSSSASSSPSASPS